MKKKILGVVTVAAIVVMAGWNFNQSKNEVVLSDLALANVEALANGETGEGKDCYNTITKQKSSKVFYCATCSWVDESTYTTFSGTDKCKPK